MIICFIYFQPRISMMPSMPGKQYDPLEELDALENPNKSPKSAEQKKSNGKPADKKHANASG